MVIAMGDYWREFPPLHELAAAWLGYEPPPKPFDGDLTQFESIAADVFGDLPPHLAKLVH